ncbi:aldehyde dehydrogenase family protein [Leifsonia virtsii]|uniref:Aldehyde dehydrogenase n=1 Tax=Leifsonia virtsii TaxID=3035915 RepID=A0ABT8IWB4_9MICO|nr:aldehyde dehydrogenase [Leifsonia virtsii]MDN4596686.1 aldehyde dehydrogenase [Leifsonia virtsii]
MIDVPVLPTRSYVDGVWRMPAEQIGVLCDPNTGRTRQPQLSTELPRVEDALAAAQRTFETGVLEHAGTATRVEVLRAWALRLDTRAEDIALQDAIATGNPLTTTRVLAGSLGDRVRGIADQAAAVGDDKVLDERYRVRLLNRPLGPTLVLAPWNAPTFVAVSKLAAAFGAGSPVLLKPSEWTPGGVQIAFEELTDTLTDFAITGSVAQLLHGGAAVGAALSSDERIRVITFTGGLTAGRAVARAAAETLAVTQLELGSNNPAIVLADADAAETARLIVAGATRLNGQWCEAPGKILVSAELHDELVDALVAEAERLRIENCLEQDCDLGPLAYEMHRDRLVGQLAAYEAEGGTVHRAGRMPSLDGWFFNPSFVTGLAADQASDEMFGPALTIHRTASVEDAVRAANRAGGGLDGFVFGVDEDEALRVGARIRAGEVRINGAHMADLADGSEQTFWDASGVGGHGPAQGVAFYQGRRVVGVDNPALPI